MKIVFYRHSIFNRGGDKMIIAHARELVDHGHTVIIQTSVMDTIFDIPPGVIIKYNKTSSKIGTLWTALTKKIQSDIIIADIIVLCTVLFFQNKNKVICFAQDYDESYYSWTIQQLFIRMIYYTGLLFFKIPVIAVSDSIAQLLKKRYNTNASVIVNGVDLHQFFHDPSPELLSNNKNPTVLILTRTDYRKGFDIAVNALFEFQKKYNTPFNIWSVGDNFSIRLPNGNHQHFGYVNETTLRRIMSSADIFLYPSRHEGFPLMVMEAFACKCPVVTSEAVSYATHEITALTSKIGDVQHLAHNLHRLVTDTELRKRLIANGFLFAEKNSLSQSSKNFVAVLTTIFAER